MKSYYPHPTPKNNNNKRKKTKRPTGLIGHPSNCSGAFAMYIHVQYDYRSNETVFVALFCSGFICEVWLGLTNPSLFKIQV